MHVLGMGRWSILSTIDGFHRQLSQVDDERFFFLLIIIFIARKTALWCAVCGLVNTFTA